ncbi:hypothetical protein NO932_06145 [Pelagibacterium sp. 26DY04]|uniref:hypothetical protein n=1 Tax=Pelagibacterium sp. 26DY04 TaxID=2967130 RepID=UPI00281687DC|nr:hypothetical protein [Pelagibacterium sp. 26DY04]WMT88189.1 hypothetical protein NO932_06145 [Pelagibacterium sp. 26DY04]
MNTANLQLEGLYLVIASLTEALVSKGVLSREEVDEALKRAEQGAINDERSVEDLSPANRDAVAFAARLLQIANAGGADRHGLSFHRLAKRVGETKPPYNDQM